MQTYDPPAPLRVHEWLAVVTILSTAIVLTLITRSSGSLPTTIDPPHFVVDQKIEVFVEGAVEQPVRLVVVKGTRVEEVLQQVRLLPEADVDKLKLSSNVRRGQHIRIPFKKRQNKK